MWTEYFRGLDSSPVVNAYYDSNQYIQVCIEVNTIMDSRLDDTDAVSIYCRGDCCGS